MLRALFGSCAVVLLASSAFAQGLFARRPTWNSVFQGTTSGVALGDVDRDGDLDMVTSAIDGNLRLHLNGGRRLLLSVAWEVDTPDSAFAVALGDVDQDGNLDAVFGGPSGVRGFRGNGQTFEDHPSWTLNGMRTNGIALGDVDDDGDLDLVCANDGPSTLFRNTQRVFEDTPAWVSTPGPAAGVALGDVDRDGRLDVVLGRWIGRNALFLNAGTTFEATPVWEADSVEASAEVALGDLDGDGWFDLVSANAGTPSSAYRNSGGTFTRDAVWRTDSSANISSLALGDVDLDGDVDVALGHSAGGFNPEGGSYVFLNESGTLSARPDWESLVEAHTASVAFADLDADGDLDLVCGNSDEPDFVYDGLQPIFGQSVWGVQGRAQDLALADLDTDGDLDLVVANAEGSTVLFRCEDGAFGSVPSWTTDRIDDARSVALGDVDGDGDLDLVTGSETVPNQLWLFDPATGGFGTVPAWSAERADGTRSVALGDADSDGDVDLLCGRDGPSYILRNRGGRFDAEPLWTSEPAFSRPSVAFADLDRDGWLDVVVASPTRTHSFRNDNGRIDVRPSWTLEFPESTFDIALGDMDGDGDPDLVCANYLDGSTLHLNQGAAADAVSFESTSAWLPESLYGSTAVALADTDADGDLDVFIASEQHARLYLNSSAGVADDPAWDSGDLAIAVACGDVEGDGDVDVVTSHIPGDLSWFPGRMAPAGGFDPLRDAARLTNEPAQLHHVRVTSTGQNTRNIAFAAFDAESDSVWVVAEFQEGGAPNWINVTSPGIVPPAAGIARGPFAASPGGENHNIVWDLSTLLYGRFPLALRLRTISNPEVAGSTQFVPSHWTDVGTVEVRRPFLSITGLGPEGLDMPVVTLGDTVTARFDIENLGNDMLRLDAIEVSDPALQLDLHPPLEIPPGDFRPVKVTYAPVTRPITRPYIRIHSNDPTSSPLQFDIVTRTLELRARTQILSIENPVPLAQALTIQTQPETFTAIERATLVFRNRDVAAEWDSLPMARLPGDDTPWGPRLANLDGGLVTEVGLEFFVILENSGITATDPEGAPTNVYEIDVQPPAELMATPIATTPGGFLAARPIDVLVDIPNGVHFVDGALYWRRGGTTPWFQAPLAAFEFDLFATIPDSGVGERGVEYWVEMNSRTSRLRFPFDGSLHPASIRVLVPSLEEATSSPGGRYRMVSFPLDFGGRMPRVDELLVDGFGPYDPRQWRVFRYDPVSAANIEVSDDRGDFFEAKPGSGVWLVSRSEHRVDTAPIEGVSTSTAGPHVMDLPKGWNQIANPFAFPVAWSAVGRSDSIAAPVAFDSKAGTAGDYVDEPVTVLQPFSAYFVHNPHPRPVTLQFSPIEATAAKSVAAESPASWARLIASCGAARDAANRFGVDARAAMGIDALDAAEPPSAPAEEWVRVAFVIDGALYRRDVRPPSEGHAWDVEVRSARRAGDVRVVIADRDRLPSDWVLRILDLEQGTSVDALDYHLISFGSERAYRLRLLAGPAAWVERAAAEQRELPAQFVTDRAGPNPFREATRFRFGIPQAASVRLDIYDVRGARVATLADGATLGAGYHVRLWDGEDHAGQRVANGVYFARLRAGDRIASWRLTVVR